MPIQTIELFIDNPATSDGLRRAAKSWLGAQRLLKDLLGKEPKGNVPQQLAWQQELDAASAVESASLEAVLLYEGQSTHDLLIKLSIWSSYHYTDADNSQLPIMDRLGLSAVKDALSLLPRRYQQEHDQSDKVTYL